MCSKAQPLHVAFLPLMAPGHMLPTLDLAKLLARRGVAATIITLPLNASLVHTSIQQPLSSGHLLRVHLVSPPPSFGACENMALLPTMSEMVSFLVSLPQLQPQLEKAFLQIRPDAIIADMFFPWTSAFARDVLGVPRFVFHATSLFSLCARDSMNRCRLRESCPEGDVSFVLPGLPHQIELLRTQVMDPSKLPSELFHLLTDQVRESELESHGVIANSFYELEPDYAKCYMDHTGIRTWLLGPLCLCNVEDKDQSKRGDPEYADHVGILKWLGSRSPGSVLYICFGSLIRFGPTQLREIVASLDSMDHPFIWVVPNNDGSSSWLTNGLEQKISEGSGVIISKWAPQASILGHVAVGAFVTHCGWNSCLEGIAAGVPMVTWPLLPEQFFNERLLVDVLRVGVGVGSRFDIMGGDKGVVVGEAITRAVEEVMSGGDDAREIRGRVREMSERAMKAMEEGGSSYEDMSHWIEELQVRV